MASISSTGIGSGLDVESIVTKLMSIEKQPITRLQTTASTIQTKISAFGQLQSAVSSFRDASLALTKATTWGATTATSSDAGAVSVSTGEGAVAGNYAISVESLATAQTAVTKTYESSSALVGAGTLRVEIGSFGQAGFAPQPNLAALSIDISPTDSLATVRNKINAAGAGVSAVIVNDTTGARLIISSTNPGSASAFRLSGDGGAADLSFDPDSDTNAMTQTLPPADAQVTINGLSVSASGNRLTDTIQGLTINLNKVTTGTVQIGVAQDNAALKGSVQSFVDSYNALAKMLATQTKYDDATKTAGKLQGDSTAVSLQRQLRNVVTSQSPASGVYPTLNSVGVTLQADGTLKIDDTKLTGALNANPAEVQKLFSASSAIANPGDPDRNGIATRLRIFGDQILGSQGALTTKTASLNSILSLNQKQQDAMTERLSLTEARMRAQYTSLDTNMSKLTALNTYISNQVAAWNKSS
ncbi:MAG TPA: flagellar filament capping protein FliD [Rhizobacter sp.]|nr:flagellar filament capping protein FliD [Rhizobacter sp.]